MHFSTGCLALNLAKEGGVSKSDSIILSSLFGKKIKRFCSAAAAVGGGRAAATFAVVPIFLCVCVFNGAARQT
jgi:hypothetical protein